MFAFINMKKIFLIVFFFIAQNNTLQAFEPKNGFHLGGFIGVGFSSDDNHEGSSAAGEFGLEAGYDITKNFDLFGRFSSITLFSETSSGEFFGPFYDFFIFYAGLRYTFKPEKFSPYILVTLSIYDLAKGGNEHIESGSGFHTSLGGGFLYYLNEKNALGLEGTYNYFATDPSAIQMILFNIIYKHTF